MIGRVIGVHLVGVIVVRSSIGRAVGVQLVGVIVVRSSICRAVGVHALRGVTLLHVLVVEAQSQFLLHTNQIPTNHSKFPQITPNFHKSLQIPTNHSKFPQITPNFHKSLQTRQPSPPLLKKESNFPH